ncbi:unnamed protein product [Vitrella brassicaformis CCMP3155]|uniref:Uncharacterized protein n=1 Tax=Vitrella brassicaformis (strain CCMP3155) TaxID=1169540 RepID=A0A0G4EM65_VITBC|nr:unnamed protein product [Vitrella brassicaformis CCMP3155]|eukprot:CEL98064.1 unnamed protein product [Vitrella brassicaformis CCMP3155]
MVELGANYIHGCGAGRQAGHRLACVLGREGVSEPCDTATFMDAGSGTRADPVKVAECDLVFRAVAEEIKERARHEFNPCQKHPLWQQTPPTLMHRQYDLAIGSQHTTGRVCTPDDPHHHRPNEPSASHGVTRYCNGNNTKRRSHTYSWWTTQCDRIGHRQRLILVTGIAVMSTSSVCSRGCGAVGGDSLRPAARLAEGDMGSPLTRAAVLGLNSRRLLLPAIHPPAAAHVAPATLSLAIEFGFILKEGHQLMGGCGKGVDWFVDVKMGKGQRHAKHLEIQPPWRKGSRRGSTGEPLGDPDSESSKQNSGNTGRKAVTRRPFTPSLPNPHNTRQEKP